MSIAAISANNYTDSSTQSNLPALWPEFKQLGAELQKANLTAAQSDLVTLQHDLPQWTSNSSSQSTNPIVEAFSQLSQDLQAGNLAAAQQTYASLEKDLQRSGQNDGQQAQTSSEPTPSTISVSA